jgi:hypothetical protein
MEPLGWLEPRAADLWMRADNDMMGGGGMDFNRAQDNSTSAQLNSLKLLTAKSIRQSTIILAIFNVVAALATALGIFLDCYFTAKRNNRDFKFRCDGLTVRPGGDARKLTVARHSGFTFIGVAESFPFVLSCGIVVQGISFAVAQSTGLDHLLILGCTVTSQMMLPSMQNLLVNINGSGRC